MHRVSRKYVVLARQGVYDASKHPGVLSKRRTEEEVTEEFISTFEEEVKDGKVGRRKMIIWRSVEIFDNRDPRGRL